MSKYVVVGSSRGLGSALVEELLKLDRAQVIGISRTGTDKIANYPKWKATGRYEHIEMDVVAADCHLTLNAISSRLPQKPVCIIFNSALVKADINNLRHIDYDVFDSINRVQIDGFGQILRAFEKHLLTHGGMLVGISSFSALFPPVMEPRIAYPASKAYLDMSLRCLRFAWNEKVKVVTVHLGHMREEGREHFLQWLREVQRHPGRFWQKVIRDQVLGCRF